MLLPLLAHPIPLHVHLTSPHPLALHDKSDNRTHDLDRYAYMGFRSRAFVPGVV